MSATKSIPPDVAAVLAKARCDGNQLELVGPRLSPSMYAKVKRTLELLGGKWNTREQSHIFSEPCEPLIKAALGNGKVEDKKQKFQFFVTPSEIVNKMLLYADVRNGMRVLEPSAGSGAIVEAIKSVAFATEIIAVEIEPTRARALKAKKCFEKDFLECNGELGTFDRILMNPPFTGGQDVKHIKHAVKFLREGGRLVAICSAGPKAEAALKPMASRWEGLPEGAFKESGTNVRTVLLMIEV